MDNTEAVERVSDSLWDKRRAAYKIFTIIRARHANEASDYVDETAQAILAAIQADPLAYVKPKPLEWRVDILEMTAEVFDIEKYYEIETLCGVRLLINGELGFPYETLEAAQTAAYDDLVSRMKELF